MKNKRIAIFLGGYLPAKKYGGPVTSISNLVDNLGDEFEFYIISNDHDFNDYSRLPGITDGWNQVGKAKVIYLKEEDFKVDKFEVIINEITPGVIYLSSIFYYQMNLPAIKAARRYNIPIILAPRGELSNRALSLGAWKKRPYLLFARYFGMLKGITFQATSQEEYENIHRVLGSRKIFLLPNMPPLSSKKKRIIKNQGSLKIITISRLVKNKNTLYSISLINRLEGKVVFDIYGPIEDAEYWKQCEEEIKKAPSNISITYKGILNPDKAKNIYLQYDCLILPTEFENYGQVIAESLMHDCPIIISKGTTPWDDVSQAQAGYTIEIGDDNGYLDALEKMTQMDLNEYEHMVCNLRDYIQKKIHYEEYRHNYIDAFESVMNKYHNNSLNT